MPDLIHLKAPNGVVIGFSLPLHESIEHQWRHGELQRVDADGNPWQGDETVPGEPGEDESPDGDAEPVRPRGNAHVSKWAAYAVALGACSEDEAADMTRAQLIELTTPPEDKAPDLEG